MFFCDTPTREIFRFKYSASDKLSHKSLFWRMAPEDEGDSACVKKKFEVCKSTPPPTNSLTNLSSGAWLLKTRVSVCVNVCTCMCACVGSGALEDGGDCV
jgi:hypothetical protein